jgi:hypothetical protein
LLLLIGPAAMCSWAALPGFRIEQGVCTTLGEFVHDARVM